MPLKKLTHWLRSTGCNRRAAAAKHRATPCLDRLDDRIMPAARLVDINSSFLSAGNQPSNLLGMSDNGRYIIFESKATDLIPGQQDVPGTNDLFWKDLQTGEIRMVTALPPITATGYDYANTRLAPQSFSMLAVVEGPPVKPSFNKAVISGDGRYVAFSSVINAARLDEDFATQFYLPSAKETLATDLENTLDVFRWEAKSGLLELASRTVANNETGGRVVALGRFGSSDTPAINGDGLFVGFVSRVDAWYTSKNGKPDQSGPIGQNDIVDGGFTQDIFVTSFDRNSGTKIQVLSAATTFGGPDGTTRFTRTLGHASGGDGVQVDPSGRYLATDLGSNVSVAYTAPRNPTLPLALGFTGDNFSLTLTVGNNRTIAGNAEAWRSSIDPGFDGDIFLLLATATDGKTVSFSGITPGGGNAQNVIIARNNPNAMVVSTSVGGFGSGLFNPAPQAPNAARQDLYFVRTDLNSQTVKVLNTQRLPATAASPTVADTTQYMLSPSGKHVVWTQVEGTRADGKDKTQVYYRQALPTVGSAQLISVTPGGAALSNGASFPRVTQNGRFVTFVSDTPASQVVSPTLSDTNNANDVFIRDLFASVDVTGKFVAKTSLLSINAAGNAAAAGNSTRGLVGTQNVDPLDGIAPSTPEDALGYAVFQSTATNIDTGFPVLHGGNSIYFEPLPIGGLPPPVPPTTAPRTGVVSGGREAGIALINFTGPGTVNLGSRLTPFPGFTGELRVASADFNGDGIPDTVVAPGPGAGPRVIIYDGATENKLYDLFVFEPSFRGGVNVAAGDISGNGKADLIVGADAGGGARVRVLDLNLNKTIADFFAYESTFRGGVRVAVGDFNADGRQDVLTAAGAGGGPRVSAFDGQVMATSGLLTRFIDFFAMEKNLRNGVYIAAGDLNNDGRDDIVVGAGAGGGPRVAVFESGSVIARPLAPDLLYNFFAGDPNSRSGIRVAVKNVDGDIYADLVTGEGFGRESRIRTFSGGKFAGPLTPTQLDNTFIVFNDVTSFNGSWVG